MRNDEKTSMSFLRLPAADRFGEGEFLFYEVGLRKFLYK